jgi:hypothetical protein
MTGKDTNEPISELIVRLQALVGLSCAFAVVGYGGTLAIHLGPLVPYEAGPPTRALRGTWRLHSDAGAWRVVGDSQTLVGDLDDETRVEEILERLSGQPLVAIHCLDKNADIRLSFASAMAVEMFGASGVNPTWAVSGPDCEAEAGPGPHWRAYHSSPMTAHEERRSLHSEECSARWKDRVPVHNSAGQCSACTYYLPLRGEWYFWDFGLCSNSRSSADGKVVHVQGGCQEFSDDLLNGRVDR